jgi:hypothetical protein
MPEHHNDDWTNAWSDRYAGGEAAAPAKRGRCRGLVRGRSTTTQVLLGSVLMATLITPFAFAQSGGGDARVERNDSRYAFLARNTRSGDGGAGALACTSNKNPTGQTNREPCLNMVNKGTGYAAAFRTRGLTGFRLQTSGEGTATPFLLDPNATGKVEHFNADAVDGLSSEQIRPRFARVTFTAPSTVALAQNDNGVASVTRTSEGLYRVAFDESVANCSFNATSAALDTTRVLSVAQVEGAGQEKNVDVSSRNAAGNRADTGFSITATC